MSKSGSRDKSTFKKILVTVDGSANANRAAAVAIEMARKNRAELTILNVVPAQATPPAEFVADPSAYWAAAEEKGREVVDEVAKRAHGLGDVKTAVVNKASSTVHEIIKFAEKEDIDLIVMGTRGRGGFTKLLLGSVSSGVLNHAHCSVLIVR